MKHVYTREMLRMRETGTHTLLFFFFFFLLSPVYQMSSKGFCTLAKYTVLIYKLCVSLAHTHAVIHQLARKLQSLWTLTPHRKTLPLLCTLAVPPPSLALPLRHPLSSLLLLLSCLFRGMWLAGCVRWPDSKSLTHSLSKFPFFTWLCTPPAASPGYAECVFITHGYTLFDPTVSAASISPLPFSVSSQASPCSDLFQCVVASRVCVRLQPCPVKYRLFKEVSNIIWPLYCNYKVLLLEIAQRKSCPQALAESVSKS